MLTATASWPTSNARLVFFVLRGVCISLAAFGLLRLGWIEAHVVLPFTLAQAALAVRVFGVPALPIDVTLACSGTDAISLSLGAIAAYLIVGMCFAFTYRAIAGIQSYPFFGSAGPGDLSDALFFSFVTLTTTGYGNLVPATNPGQSLAVMEAVLGQLFLVTAVAKIITAWKPRGWRRPEEPD